MPWNLMPLSRIDPASVASRTVSSGVNVNGRARRARGHIADADQRQLRRAAIRGGDRWVSIKSQGRELEGSDLQVGRVGKMRVDAAGGIERRRARERPGRERTVLGRAAVNLAVIRHVVRRDRRIGLNECAARDDVRRR